MRGAIKRLTLLAAALMLMAVPALAAENTVEDGYGQLQQTLKEDCMIVASNCKPEPSPIEQRIDKIKKEIGRGTDVYTTDELKALQRELDNANRHLMEMYSGGV